jgi:hypothetical protein
MKKILFFFAFVMFAATSYGQGKISFKAEAHDFGKVEEGGAISHDYVFTNTGNVPVVISNVQPSCGCTTPNWTREPVMPGKTGIVTASFGTQGRVGQQNKTVTVVSNSETPSITLSFHVEVTPKAAAPAATPAPAPATVAAPAPAPAAVVPAAATPAPKKKGGK